MKEKINITIDSELLKIIEKQRGLVNRSLFIEELLRKPVMRLIGQTKGM